MNSINSRTLTDLRGVGPAILRDLRLLGVHTVEDLAGEDPAELYERLQVITGRHQDICVLDVFCCAVAQAGDPRLPAEDREWWTWSRRRKARAN